MMLVKASALFSSHQHVVATFFPFKKTSDYVENVLRSGTDFRPRKARNTAPFGRNNGKKIQTWTGITQTYSPLTLELPNTSISYI